MLGRHTALCVGEEVSAQAFAYQALIEIRVALDGLGALLNEHR